MLAEAPVASTLFLGVLDFAAEVESEAAVLSATGFFFLDLVELESVWSPDCCAAEARTASVPAKRKRADNRAR